MDTPVRPRIRGVIYRIAPTAWNQLYAQVGTTYGTLYDVATDIKWQIK